MAENVAAIGNSRLMQGAVSVTVIDCYTLESKQCMVTGDDFFGPATKVLKWKKRADEAFNEKGVKLTDKQLSELAHKQKVWVKSTQDSRSKKSQDTIRLVVVGPPQVGKSAVTFRYLNDNFIVDHDPTVEDTWSHTKKIDNVSVRVDILDTAGLEDYQGDMANWVIDKDGLIFVYDITNKNSWNRLEGMRRGIYEDLTEEEIPEIIILGNKCDLQDERAVDKETVSKTCKEWRCLFEETSAKDDLRITEAFVALIRQHLKKVYPPKEKGGWDCTIL